MHPNDAKNDNGETKHIEEDTYQLCPFLFYFVDNIR
jgi:hypothetical protein